MNERQAEGQLTAVKICSGKARHVKSLHPEGHTIPVTAKIGGTG